MARYDYYIGKVFQSYDNNLTNIKKRAEQRKKEYDTKLNKNVSITIWELKGVFPNEKYVNKWTFSNGKWTKHKLE